MSSRRARAALQRIESPRIGASVEPVTPEVPTIPAVDVAPDALREAIGDELLNAALIYVRNKRHQVAVLEADVTKHVALLRGRGASWAGVGWILGTTAEAARKRYGR